MRDQKLRQEIIDALAMDLGGDRKARVRAATIAGSIEREKQASLDELIGNRSVQDFARSLTTRKNPTMPTVTHFINELSHNIIVYDKAAEKREVKRGGRVNIHRIGILLGALREVKLDTHDIGYRNDGEALTRLRYSIQKHFNVRGFPPAEKIVRKIDVLVPNWRSFDVARANPSDGISPVLIAGGVAVAAVAGYLILRPKTAPAISAPAPTPRFAPAPTPAPRTPATRTPATRTPAPGRTVTTPPPAPVTIPPPVPATEPPRAAVTSQSDKRFIRNVQRMLNTFNLLGRPGDNSVVTGSFGSATTAALRAFQTHAHLPVTGIVDGTTATRLNYAYEQYVATYPNDPVLQLE